MPTRHILIVIIDATTHGQGEVILEPKNYKGEHRYSYLSLYNCAWLFFGRIQREKNYKGEFT